MLFRKNFKNQTSYSLNDESFLRMLGIDSNTVSNDKLGEITYFTCLKNLAESIAKLPINLYQRTEKGKVKVQHNLQSLFDYELNPYFNNFMFISTCEVMRNHFGNAYIYINSSKGKVKDLWILPSDQVSILIDNAGVFGRENALWYRWINGKTGKEYRFSHKEIIHLKTSVSLDGITGLAIKDVLKLNIETSQAAQQYLNKFCKSGMFGGKAIVQYTGDLDVNGEQRVVSRIESFTSNPNLSGKIIPLPLGFTIQTLNMNMTDAQFMELNKYNAIQVAGAFGIKPYHLNDYSAKFNNSEMQQQDFYINTSLAILTQYEQEFSKKLFTSIEKENGYIIKFNTNGILRADFATQIKGLSMGVNNAIYTPNEARNYLDMAQIEGGDVLMCNGNYIPIEKIGSQYMKGVDNNE